MKEFLILLQFIFLVTQITVLVKGILNKENILSYGYGFAIWGSIPNIFCALIVKLL